MDKQVAKVPLTKTAPAGPALRASDADRDRIAEILREALAEGRLTAEEHAERVEGAYRARTLAELEPLVHDLPAAYRPADAPAPERPPADGVRPEAGANLIAVFGGAGRKGRWQVPARINAVAIFGGVEIDLTEATFTQQHVVINVVALFGGVDIKFPENVSVRCTGTGIFGGFDVSTHEAPDAQAPVITVTGCAIFGGVAANPKRGKRVRNLND
ncbi:DUF1707 domain-containing protein [Streptomyces orinoci]|uniref:DUF1707 domain-containing protein n=1 Tax=Streptomyces orinoci TaxID=67339 RepID=A0ABV3JSH1_STRON|nr:DUF1707 domain-containing protein [Streptomyces orinoci]